MFHPNTKSITVEANVLHFLYADLHTYPVPDFLNLCTKSIEVIESKENIVIPGDATKALIDIELQHISQGRFTGQSTLTFPLNEPQIREICITLYQFLSDPFKVMSHLQELDQALGQKMRAHNLTSYNNISPDTNLIAFLGYFIPGPPPDNYQPLIKANFLDILLLERERGDNINKAGYAPKFAGFLERGTADKIVADGELFTEYAKLTRVLLHGSFSHRLLGLAIRESMQKGELKIELSFRQLLEFLTKITLTYPGLISKSLWDFFIDKIVMLAGDQMRNVNFYTFTCRSPVIFNSLLLCFGQQLNLANLQVYLLDSYYKSVFQMIHRMRVNMEINQIEGRHTITLKRLYLYCMNALMTIDLDPGQLMQEWPFALTLNLRPPRSYQPRSVTGVYQKIPVEKKPGVYPEGWQGFFNYRQQETDSEKNIFIAECQAKGYGSELGAILRHCAKQGMVKEVSECLFLFHANPNAVQLSDGQTALHLIAYNLKDSTKIENYKECTRILIKFGAERKKGLKNYPNATPEAYARRNGYPNWFDDVMKSETEKKETVRKQLRIPYAASGARNPLSVSY